MKLQVFEPLRVGAETYWKTFCDGRGLSSEVVFGPAKSKQMDLMISFVITRRVNGGVHLEGRSHSLLKSNASLAGHDVCFKLVLLVGGSLANCGSP